MVYIVRNYKDNVDTHFGSLDNAEMFALDTGLGYPDVIIIDSDDPENRELLKMEM